MPNTPTFFYIALVSAMSQNLYKGGVGERIAAEYLIRHHAMQLIAQNVRIGSGEIDLILRDQNTIVFCEVKTRIRASKSDALAAIDRRKRQMISKTAIAYLMRHDLMNRPVRFDIVVITGYAEQMEITHIPEAFLFDGSKYYI